MTDMKSEIFVYQGSDRRARSQVEPVTARNAPVAIGRAC